MARILKQTRIAQLENRSRVFYPITIYEVPLVRIKSKPALSFTPALLQIITHNLSHFYWKMSRNTSVLILVLSFCALYSQFVEGCCAKCKPSISGGYKFVKKKCSGPPPPGYRCTGFVLCIYDEHTGLFDIAVSKCQNKPDPDFMTPTPTIETPDPSFEISPSPEIPSPSFEVPSPSVEVPGPSVEDPGPSIEGSAAPVQTSEYV